MEAKSKGNELFKKNNSEAIEFYSLAIHVNPMVKVWIKQGSLHDKFIWCRRKKPKVADG